MTPSNREAPVTGLVDSGAYAAGRASYELRLLWLGAGLVLILHVAAVPNGFFMDDYAYLQTARNFEGTWSDLAGLFITGNLSQEASSVWWTPTGVLPFYRPLAVLTVALEYRLWGLHPGGYHLTNLALHVVTLVCVGRLARRMGQRTSVAVASALVFAVHPMHNEAVVWMSGRFDLLVSVFVLCSTLSYLAWREGSGTWAAIGSLVCFILALGCKETGLVTPAALGLAEVFRPAPNGPGPLRRRRVYAFLLVTLLIAAAYLAVRWELFGGLGRLPPPYGVDLGAPGALLEVLRNVAQYVLDFVLFIQADAVVMSRFWHGHTVLLWGTVGLATVVAGAGLRWVRRERAVGFGLMWAVLFTGPALLAMPGERNVYLAAAGVGLIGGSIVQRAVSTRRGPRVLGAVVLVATLCSAGEHLLMNRLTVASDQLYADLRRLVPDPLADSYVYVVNQYPFAAIGFTAGVRLMYDREDVTACALSVAPQVWVTSTDTIAAAGATVQLVRRNGRFFDGFFERLLLFGIGDDELPAAAARVGLAPLGHVLGPPAPETITLRLPESVDSPRIHLLCWDNSDLRTVFDSFRYASRSRLSRCVLGLPSESDGAGATSGERR